MLNNTTVIVIPTYNEKDNIKKLISEILKLSLPVDILVVDDDSPDETGDIVESMKETTPNLDIMHRKKKEGLGPAYVEAFRYILNEKKYDYIIQMDADFSHNPKDIPRLLEAARSYDVVVGSRYIKGGGVSDQWSTLRKLISRMGNIYARIITGLNIKDCTAGFKCYKWEALQSISLEKIFLNGYGFQIQILYELNKANLSMGEIPIFFDERTKGVSKMNLKIVVEAFFSLILLRFKNMFFKK